MKQTFLAVSIMFSTIQLTAQQNSVATGGNTTGAGGSMSYTVGQIDYQSNSGSNGNVNQGIQQPYELFEVASLNELDLLLTTVFPNPTNGIVSLTVSTLETHLNFALYDLSGRILKQNPVVSTQTNIDLSELAPGEYLLQISNDTQQNKTVKIIKH